jgi:ABC-2 type transport system ATP-binding protein
MQPIISISNLTKTYASGLQALKDVNLDIRRGEIFADVPRDRIEIATFAFIFTGHTLEPVDITGRVCIEVRDLVKEVRDRASGKPKRLLDQIQPRDRAR